MKVQNNVYRPLFLVSVVSVCVFVVGIVIGRIDYNNRLRDAYNIIKEHESVSDNKVKRYLWWVIGAVIFKTAELVFSWQGIYDSCRHFTESGWNAAQCIYGALSTIAIYSGASYSAARQVGRLAQWANNNGITILGTQWLAGLAKRDTMWNDRHHNITVGISGYNHTFFDTGHHWNFTTLYTNGSLYEGMAPSDRIPIFNVHGARFNHHIAMVYVPEHNHTLFKLGFGHIQHLEDLTKRGDYDEQYFTEGGIDFAVDIQDESGEGVVSTSNDYGQMDHEVSCYMGNQLDTNCFAWQIYDNNNHGTIGAGAAGPYSGADGEAYYAEDCYKSMLTRRPLPESGNCEVS